MVYAMLSWLQVEIAEYPGCGFGLRAKKDMKVVNLSTVRSSTALSSSLCCFSLQMEEKVMVIPDKLMMNSLTARDGLLGT